MSLQFLCGLMVFVLLASNIGSAEDVVNNEENTGTDENGGEGPSGFFAKELASAGLQIDYLFGTMAGQIVKLNLEVETLKNAIQKGFSNPLVDKYGDYQYVFIILEYTGVEPAPEPGSIGEPGEGQEPGPETEPEPGTLGGRSTLERLKKLLAERKLSDQKESKINALRRMLEPHQ